MAASLPAPGSHTSEYTNGELKALLAPVIGIDPEQIEGLAIVADLGDRFTMAGIPDTDMGKLILIQAIMGGLLEA